MTFASIATTSHICENDRLIPLTQRLTVRVLTIYIYEYETRGALGWVVYHHIMFMKHNTGSTNFVSYLKVFFKFKMSNKKRKPS